MAFDLDRIFFKYAVFFPVVALRGERVFHYLRALEASQYDSPAQLRAAQDVKLDQLLRRAAADVPFYRDRLRAVSGRAPVEQLATLPYLTKLDLIHSNASLRNPRHRGPVTIKTTGGSTGQAVTVQKSRHATALEAAANWRGFRWAGIDIGDRQARFWGVPVSRRGRWRARAIDWVAHRRRFSAFQFATADLERYVADLGRFRPRYLYGYVSMLRALAVYLLEQQRSFPSRLEAVVSTSEPLTPPDRRLFEQAFAARVFNEYGCGELGTIAHECDRGRLHLHAENLHVEIVGAAGAPAITEPGEVIVTELNNHAMPLIRYRLGDFASWDRDGCPCGRTLPMLTNVFGRSYDMITNRRGEQFHGEFFMYIFEDARAQRLGVDAFQVIQQDVNHILVRIVPQQSFGARSEAFVRERIQAGLGSDVDVTFERVDEIRREKSGKLRLVIGMRSSVS